MKRIGLLGGMSWESSIEYERIINETVRSHLGGTHSADLIVRSYDFATIAALQEKDRWDEAAELLTSDALMLESAGAEIIVLCTNTMHIVAPQIEAAIDAQFIHIGDATANAVRANNIKTIGLLGTRYTMERPFLVERLNRNSLDVLVPDEMQRSTIHDVIFNELVRGIVSPSSKARYLEIIDDLIAQGAEGIVAGCTEIELLVQPADIAVPYFPTAKLHAEAAVLAALASESS